MMIKIPKANKDLRSYVIKKDVFRMVVYLLWLAIWYLGAHLYNQNHQTYPPHRLMLGWKLLLWMLASALLGFFLFRIWTFFTDRTYCAVIVKSGLSQSYEASKDPGFHNATDYDFRLNTALQLQKLGGKKKKSLRFEQKPGFYFYYYEETKIVKYHGLPYPIAVGNFHPDSPARICSACGQKSNTPIDRCDFCGFTLIDPEQIDLSKILPSQ
jgi:hypothetical protein